jgi:catechol 2,3-dioxygenase-like lactoylglutathione lyase family enzyme
MGLGSRPALAFLLLLSAQAHAEVLTLRTIGVTVSDLERTERFYRDTLDFHTIARKHVAGPERNTLFGVPAEAMDVLTMQLGEQQVEFTRFEHPGHPYPADSRSPDLWFQHFAIIVSNMDAAYARVHDAGVAAISDDGPQTLPPRNGGVRAFKFRDPDGHPLELLWFPKGQGRAMWQQRPGLFLGIDHSAIAVSATQTSLAFYRDRLGMRVAYEVTNIGPTQDHLDGVAGAVVQITGLLPAAQDAPGIEFLNYQSPPSGRPALNIRADDIVHAHLTLVVDDLAEILASPGLRRLSASAVAMAPQTCAASVLDPDGHVVVLEQVTHGPLPCGP